MDGMLFDARTILHEGISVGVELPLLSHCDFRVHLIQSFIMSDNAICIGSIGGVSARVDRILRVKSYFL